MTDLSEVNMEGPPSYLVSGREDENTKMVFDDSIAGARPHALR